MTEKNDPTDTHSITRTLETYADRAALMPPNLVTRVEQRYQRRRRMRASALASVAVLVVAALVSTAGLAMMSRPGKAESAPAAPSSARSAWLLPKPAPYPEVASVWPSAILDPPPKAPDHDKIFPMTMLDPTHLLAYSEPSFEAAGGFLDRRDAPAEQHALQVTNRCLSV
jgi:hypothetical protein